MKFSLFILFYGPKVEFYVEPARPFKVNHDDTIPVKMGRAGGAKHGNRQPQLAVVAPLQFRFNNASGEWPIPYIYVGEIWGEIAWHSRNPL